MKTLFKAMFLFCLLLLSPVIAKDKEQRRFTLTNYGVYEIENEKIEDTECNVTGKMNIIRHSDSIKFSKETSIKGNLNTCFGIEFSFAELKPNSKEVITQRFIHPKIKNPNTHKMSTIDNIPYTIMYKDHNIMGWKFNEEWEIARGEWKFQIIHEGIVVLEKVFIVE